MARTKKSVKKSYSKVDETIMANNADILLFKGVIWITASLVIGGFAFALFWPWVYK